MLGPYGSDTPGDVQTGGLGGGAGLLGALVETGGALYDSAQNRKAAKQNTDKTIAANLQQADLAYQRQVQMWNMQNEYNSPEAQMARFKAAGLNPNLIYGQGSAGNASSFPQYQPPQIRYQYVAPTYGAAISSLLPTLMSVGSWMQDMALKRVQLRKAESGIDLTEAQTSRARQLIDFLASRNPQLLKEAENKLSLFPYQKSAQRYAVQHAYGSLADMEMEHRYKFGRQLFGGSDSIADRRVIGDDEVGGVRKLQFIEQYAKSRLAEAQSSWADFDITNPQAIMQMVFQGVMGMAGQQLRLSTYKSEAAKSRRHQMLMRSR